MILLAFTILFIITTYNFYKERLKKDNQLSNAKG